MSNSANSAVFREEVRALSAYKVAESQNLIKLDAMENPYRWPQGITEQWLALLRDCAMNRYPNPEPQSLLALLKQTNQIPENSAVLLGNGSDEIIQLLLMAIKPDAQVLTPEPGFVMYKQVASSLGLHFHGIPLTEDFGLDLSAMLAAIDDYQPALTFIAYPNNPTGNLFDRDAIKTLIAASPGLVVIDEAYAPFANTSFMAELAHYHNLLVMRTLSKLGLAGLRLGFIAGHPELIAQLNKIRLPYNINCLTQLTAEFALANIEFLEEQTQRLCQQRGVLFEALNSLPEIKVYPSSANFILFKTIHTSADTVFERIKQQGVLIKNLSPQGSLLSNCLRVTIGTEKENQSFLNALRNALR